MNAEKYNLDRIYFGGYFIRGTSCTASQTSCTPARPSARELVWPHRTHHISDGGLTLRRRSRGDDQHALVRHPVLEQGDEARAVPAARRIPVRVPPLAISVSCRWLIIRCLLRVALFRGAIGAWIKNIGEDEGGES